ncbi:hypothetical protein FA15DRAFT_705394 [Coprinopsis marcescibilis]|uniref:Uncharacterized protein n=1 Tax=Coprinopsis marcescibilis TaxID=230819 RepID=A0A5C3KST3_COPMA|nr:hypothetical protein FA15DRAFT_705394 [Coprinopsis marcescibilis]
MSIRVYAICGNRSVIRLWLIFQFIGVSIAVYTLAFLFLVNMEYMPSPLPKLVACVPKTVPAENLSVVFAIFMASETVLMLTSIVGFWKFRRSATRLLATLRQDGIIYFVILAAVSTGNIIFDTVAPKDLRFMLAAPQVMLHSILSCRMVLHLHEVSETEFLILSGSTVQSDPRFPVPRESRVQNEV